jgi:hypothetical protein
MDSSKERERFDTIRVTQFFRATRMSRWTDIQWPPDRMIMLEDIPRKALGRVVARIPAYSISLRCEEAL